MNTEGILGRRLNWWRCFPLEMDGRMPCESCECFDRSTLECVQPGGRVGHEVLNMVRDRYVKGPQCPEVPTSAERREVAEDEEPDDFDFDSSFEIMCEEVIKSIWESALDALERAGVECGERAVSDDDK